ncbi:MAG: BspA family leucine-rich repeat surface protein [Winogradskyella sp.]|uniref:BspA family leucine-rich repeat surface protein n=1 Tax=Winogradskyella sp. TaxID=1883156 RepID=UPI000F3B69FD|nr:BspA family leucine-rich repeat surface protein [Winogradskyella sp.]RNC88377.1 MAG: BspA family leucine-rich repeat surface protein [Winogradskyella sp.]
MKLKLAFLVSSLIVFTSISSYSQNLENSKWYFGINAALNFDTPSNNPEPIIGPNSMSTRRNAASVADENGNLLFYSDGNTVYSSNHQVMVNGNNLSGSKENIQGALIVPAPEGCQKYFLFNLNGTSPNIIDRGLTYNVIDMSLNNGLGEVIDKNIVLISSNDIAGSIYSNKITSTLHTERDKVWVVVQIRDKFYSYLVTNSGVQIPVISGIDVNGLTINDEWSGYGGFKISPNGRRLGACYSSITGNGGVHVYDFDATTGLISNLNVLPNSSSFFLPLGLEFSPNSNYIYYSTLNSLFQDDVPRINKESKLYQVGLNNNRRLAVNPVIIGNLNDNGLLQLGRNGKIYLAGSGNILGVINNPDVFGLGAGYQQNGVALPNGTMANFSLPLWVNVPNVNNSCDVSNFITTWQVDNTDPTITIPTFPGETYNYDVDWEGDGVFDDFGVIGDITHDYGTSGTYEVHIRGDFPRIFFNSGLSNNTSANHDKIIAVNQWGSQVWTSMVWAFSGCGFLEVSANDTPDLSIVTDMSWMFYNCHILNQSLNNWDVSNVTNMSWMFSHAYAFNQPLNNWDVSNVTNMRSMFSHADTFNQPLNNWEVSNVTNMRSMFSHADTFNQPLNNWDVSNVTNMNGMFSYAYVFNRSLNNWDVSNVTDMGYMFFHSDVFTQPLNNWDVSNVNNMRGMFSNAFAFNQSLNDWDVSNVTDMGYMFIESDAFNQPLNNWDVSNVTDMSWMFSSSSVFNQPLNDWDVSNVTDMNAMFYFADVFNQPLNDWDVSNVTDMSWMFSNSESFNQPLNNWDVINTTDMSYMFYFADVFNQPLNDWDVSSVTDMNSILAYTNLSTFNYDQTLIGWSELNSLQTSVNFGALGVTYCSGASARQNLIDDFGWTIDDGGIAPSCKISARHDIDLNIFPNPTRNIINLDFTSQNSFNFYTEVKNIYGVTIIVSNNKKYIDLSKLKTGIYFIKVTTDLGETIIKQVIKK